MIRLGGLLLFYKKMLGLKGIIVKNSTQAKKNTSIDMEMKLYPNYLHRGVFLSHE